MRIEGRIWRAAALKAQSEPRPPGVDQDVGLRGGIQVDAPGVGRAQRSGVHAQLSRSSHPQPASASWTQIRRTYEFTSSRPTRTDGSRLTICANFSKCPETFSVGIEPVCREVRAAKRGMMLCIEPLDPIGSSELPGFSTGYLIGCAVVASIIAVELVVAILLQQAQCAPMVRQLPLCVNHVRALSASSG